MSGARRLMLSGIGLTALLALVAVSSRAHKPGGGSGAGPAHPPRLIWEYIASAIVVLFPIMGALMIWGLAHSRREKLLAGQRNWRRTVALMLAVTPLLIAAFIFVHHLKPLGRGPAGVATIPSSKAPKGKR